MVEQQRDGGDRSNKGAQQQQPGDKNRSNPSSNPGRSGGDEQRSGREGQPGWNPAPGDQPSKVGNKQPNTIGKPSDDDDDESSDETREQTPDQGDKAGR